MGCAHEPRTDLALTFIRQHTRPGHPVTHRQIADHLTERTGIRHSVDMVRALLGVERKLAA